MDQSRKIKEINAVLSEPRVDLWKLRELALTEGGLVNDTLRKRAWPKLVGLYGFYSETLTEAKAPNTASGSRSLIRNEVQIVGIPSERCSLSHAETLGDERGDSSSVDPKTSIMSNPSRAKERYSAPNVPPSDDADQIDRDVARCTWHLLTGNQRSRRVQMKNKHRKKVASVLRKKQRRLGSLINLTLLRNYGKVPHKDRLHYYQGYHDVASIFLSALGGGGLSQAPKGSTESVDRIAASLGLDLPSRVLAQVSETHLRDALHRNFVQLQTALRLVLMPLIWYFDLDIHDHLADCDMEPVFAVSWIITWFSHDIRDTDLVKRLFDAFLVSHPLLPVYMTVAMICHPYNRLEILSTECDFSLLHQTLTGLPKNSSMVGWKYQVGDGYVSGEEEDEGTATTDIGTATTNMDVSVLSEDIMDRELEFREEGFQSMQSPIAGPLAVGSKAPKAPFQALLDTALLFMRRVPPRSLIDLSKRYYSDEALGPMMEMAPSIFLLQPPPKWSVTGSCTADWILKERRTGKQLSRRDRRRFGMRSVSPFSRHLPSGTPKSRAPLAQSAKTPYEPVAPSEDRLSKVYLEKMKGTLPVIACGFGPGDDEIVRKKRKRRKRMLAVGALVVVVTISCISIALIRGRSGNSSSTVLAGEQNRRMLQLSSRALVVQSRHKSVTCTTKTVKIGAKSDRDEAMVWREEAQNKGASRLEVKATMVQTSGQTKKVSSMQLPNLPITGSTRSTLHGQSTPEPVLPAQSRHIVAIKTAAMKPGEKSRSKEEHQGVSKQSTINSDGVTRALGAFMTEAREANTWTLEEAVHIMSSDMVVLGYEKILVPVMRKLKGGSWMALTKRVLLPVHERLTTFVLPAARGQLQSHILPGTFHLFGRNVIAPFKSQVVNVKRALVGGVKKARVALIEGHRGLLTYLRETGEALREDELIL